MRRKRKVENVQNICMDRNTPTFKMFSLLKSWIVLLSFTSMWRCEAVQVYMREERRFAMLFQSVVLPCQYSTVSTQTPVVQWWYKSYCRDRTREAFSFPENLVVRVSDLGSYSHLDCADSARTVRIVASKHGSSITLAEYYRGRDISIINKADLRIGELQWGDSGVYACKVVIANDPEGKNEAQVELLVLEWAFVGAVVFGSFLFILLLGVCWCQCCPHSCCCYVRCCCCPDTCCCPRHLYEAGKGIKTAPSTPVAMYPPYFMQGMPTMVPIAPPSFIDPKMSATPSVENNASGVHNAYRLQPASDQNSLKVLQYVEKELAHFNPSKTLSSHGSCSMSELSSLHEMETDFHQNYLHVQKKALPAIPDLDNPADLLSKEIAPSHVRRSARHPHRGNRLEEDYPRWNPRSEHLQRKAFQMGGRTGSLDELEEFAMSYMRRDRHGDISDLEDDYWTHERQRERTRERDRDRERERELDRERYPYYSSNCYYSKGSPERHRDRPRPPSPPPHLHGNSKRRGTWDSDRPIPRRDATEREDSRGQDGESGQDYDDTLLISLLERKAKAGRTVSSKSGHTEDDSDTPSKNSSKKTTSHSQSPSSGSPGNRPAKEDDSLPPYAERELERSQGGKTSQRPFGYTRSAKASQVNPKGREQQSRTRKVRPSRV